MTSFRTLIVASALALASASALAQWGWTDGSGRKNYSDTPPPASVPDRAIFKRPGGGAPAAATRNTTNVTSAAPAADMEASNAPAAVAPAASAPVVDKALEEKKRQADAAEAAKKKAELDKQAAMRAENCKRAQNSLAMLKTGRLMMRSDEKGAVSYVDPKTREAEIKRAQGIVNSDCGPMPR